MTKVVQRKFRADRRLGVNLWGRAKSPINTKNYGPGQHGQRRGKLSDYGKHHFAKQQLKWYYGIRSEKQFRATFDEAIRRRGDTSKILLELLERRLDSVIYRMKFAPTVFAARQVVNHGHVKVNGKRVNIGSYRVKDGDTIEISDNMKQNEQIMAAAQSPERDLPVYVTVDHNVGKGTFVRTPEPDEIPYPVQMEPNMIVEYYSQ